MATLLLTFGVVTVITFAIACATDLLLAMVNPLKRKRSVKNMSAESLAGSH